MDNPQDYSNGVYIVTMSFLGIVGCVNAIVVILCMCVFSTHGPAIIFLQEPFKTIGTLQTNPAFLFIFAWNFLSLCVIVLWTKADV